MTEKFIQIALPQGCLLLTGKIQDNSHALRYNYFVVRQRKLQHRDPREETGGNGRGRTLADAGLEAAALPLSYTPNWYWLSESNRVMAGTQSAALPLC